MIGLNPFYDEWLISIRPTANRDLLFASVVQPSEATAMASTGACSTRAVSQI